MSVSLSTLTVSPLPQRRPRGPTTDAVYADTKCFRAASPVVAMAASYNGTIWLAMQDGRVEVRDAHTGQPVHTFAIAGVRQRRSKVWCMLSVFDVLNNEAQMWMGLSSGAIEVYTEAYQLRRQISKHISGVYCLAQYRGAVVYAGSADFTITQWRVRDGQLLRVMTGHTNYIRCLYAEGSALISGADDNSIRVWDVASGACLQHYTHLHRGSGGVSALCRVGTAMWSGDDSGAVAVWRLKDGVALLVCRQLAGRVTALRKVGTRVYASGAEGRICVFNASDCTVAARLDDHGGSHVSSLACAVEVDRYFVWSSSADNTVRCWHHDEHQPMTADREGFLDMRWYYATQQPYVQANEELLEQHREVTELLTLYCGSDEAVRHFLDTLGSGRETGAARYWMQDAKLKETQKKSEAAEEETRSIEAMIARKTQTLQLLKDQLARLTEALNTARRNQPAGVAQPVPSVGVAVVPSVLPPVAAPTTTAVAAAATPAAPVLPAPPPSAAVPLPPPPSSLISALAPVPPPPVVVVPSAAPLPPPPPAAVPPPPAAVVPVPSQPVAAPRVITETQTTLSRSYEPVLGALPPPPSAGGAPKKTMGALFRMSSGGSAPPPLSQLGGSTTAVPATVVVPALPPSVAVPLPPPGVVVPSRPDGPRTPPDTPLPKASAPRVRRMSF